MEASYKMNIPASRSCLWYVSKFMTLMTLNSAVFRCRDNSATDEQVDLHLTSSQ